MSGHRKFSELTKKFTQDDWRQVEKIKAEMLETIKAESDKRKRAWQKTRVKVYPRADRKSLISRLFFV